MGTVTISGNDHTIYGSHAAAIAHLGGSITPAAALFVAAADTKQKQALISAARVLNKQEWNDDADTFAERDAIAAFQEASYELAALLLVKPGLFDQKSADSNVQSVTAGPTSVTFFRGNEVGRFPTLVQDLIGGYLKGAESAIGGGSERLGGCASSQFDDCDRYGLNRGT